MLEYTEKVVRHCGQQQGCGIGEIPSLPQLIPKVLIRSFKFLSLGDSVSTSSDLKAGIHQCFVTSRSLFSVFLAIFDEIKIRTVLEDELELLVKLCQDLVTFHDVLLPLDFKLTCMVWKLYLNLTNKYHGKLENKIDFSRATETVSQELVSQFTNLRNLMTTLTQDDNINKDVTKVAYLMKVVQPAASLGVGQSPSYLSLLQEVFLGLPDPPHWVPDVAKKKLVSDVMSPNIKHNLLKFALKEPFLTYLLEEIGKKTKDPRPTLQMLIEILLSRPGQEVELFNLCLSLTSRGGCCLLSPEVDGRQVLGRSVVKVDTYTWLLTNICSYIASLTEEEFGKLERVLMSHLLSLSSSPVTLMMISDILCFIARYSTSQLCLSHLKFLHNVEMKMGRKCVSLNLIFIQKLLTRLESFLSPSHRKQWQLLRSEKKEMKKCSNLNDKSNVCNTVDMWRRLSFGNYHPVSTVASVSNVSDLVHQSIKDAGTMTKEQRGVVLNSMMSIYQKSDKNPVFLMQILRTVVSFVKIGVAWDSSVVDDMYSEWQRGGKKNIYVEVLFISLYKSTNRQLPNGLNDINCFKSSATENCSCCHWTRDKGSNFGAKIADVQTGETLSRQSTLEGRGSSQNNKKRKFSEDKENQNIEASIKRMERELIFLENQEVNDLKKYKVGIYDISSKIQKLLNRVVS